MKPKFRLETSLARDLRAAQDAGKLALAAEWVGQEHDPFHLEAMDLIAAALRESPDHVTEWLRSLPANANAAYLAAKLCRDGSETAAWAGFLKFQESPDAVHLLAYASALAQENQWNDAAVALRRAIERRPPYGFFARAAKLVRQAAEKAQTQVRQCRIALLARSTTSLLAPLLEAFLFRDRIKGEIYEGLYGSLEQEILDPSSGLARFRPDLVFLISNWRDLHLPATVEDESAFLAAELERVKMRWEQLASRFGCHVVQLACDFPACESGAYLSNSLPGGRSRVIELLNRRMIEQCGAQVSILNAPAVQRTEGARWESAMLWHNFQQHPAAESLPALAEAMSAHVRAVLGLTRKVLVTDLDNTLWGGVIGEDGLDGIKIGPGSPAGEAHQRLQEYLLDLKSRGILLAAASKNSQEDAALPFLKHPHMLLRMEDFAAFEANWNDKAQSLGEIARKLSLGLDSLVFLDDNPLERAWVRSQHPDVAVVDPGASIFDYVQNLDRGGYFFSISLSAEDRARSLQYRSEAARKHLQASAPSLDDFLRQLQLRASVSAVQEGNLARVTQLTNKTNQFNLTTRRYTEAQVSQLARDPSAWAAAFRLADSMGDYGLIGVIFCRTVADRVWEIDSWLMSCRVLGRQMEKYMFDRLLEAARSRGIESMEGVYRPTPKNGLVRELYPQFGFARVSEAAEEIRYRLAVPDGTVLTATHVRDMSDPAMLAAQESV